MVQDEDELGQAQHMIETLQRPGHGDVTLLTGGDDEVLGRWSCMRAGPRWTAMEKIASCRALWSLVRVRDAAVRGKRRTGA